jgi:[1-hydroxy-2-(trimethylamino)ethyl]phosphonate dioxygenase
VAVSDEIVALFERGGGGAYYGEPVTVLEHGLQAAHFAVADGAGESLVVAALVHDVGHLLNEAPDDIADWHADARHELVGSAWLARHFGPAVCDPVRLHVPAKRYLCATAATYRQSLSPASLITLELQGGPMSDEEAAAFRREPYFRDAVRLRLFDDRGKVAGLATASLDDYRPLLDRLATAR